MLQGNCFLFGWRRARCRAGENDSEVECALGEVDGVRDATNILPLHSANPVLLESKLGPTRASKNAWCRCETVRHILRVSSEESGRDEDAWRLGRSICRATNGLRAGRRRNGNV